MSFSSVTVVDWAGAGDTGARPRKDAIWAATHRSGVAEAPVYLRNRGVALAHLDDRIGAALAAGERALIALDFPFGYPAGFARAVTGSDAPLKLWEWFANALPEAAAPSARFELAARLNARFPAPGPFWFNGLRRDVPGLPRRTQGRDMAAIGLAERRAAEARATGAFTLWQMGGPGAVGSQAMTGMATLARLRAARPGAIAVWPFEPLDRPVALVEVWPSLIDGAVRALAAPEEIRDAAQVRVLAAALAEAAGDGRLDAWLADVPPGAPRSEEGWILGLGHAPALAAAARSGLMPDLTPPRLGNDCFALPQGVDWTPVDAALETLRARLRPVVGRERIATHAAAGRVLAADAVAARSNPPGANSAVDGYGFAADPSGATVAGRHVLPLLSGRAAAGAPYREAVPTGKALRVLTGALLPNGVDTVVLEEDCRVGGGAVAFAGPVKPGANTRASGEDVAAGAVALTQGRVLGPADLALATALGLSRLEVHAQLRVGVLSTGDEIAPPGATPAGPEITYDANRPMLLALATRWGHRAVDLGHARDARDALADRLDEAADAADAILTTGGASAGDEDHVSALLRECGAMTLWRVAMKPGRPLALGLWRGVPVFGLPGNPVAAFVCALIFARPSLALLSGAAWSVPRAVTVPAAFAKRKKPGRREYLRARLDARGHAEVFASEGSGRISGLAWAEGLVELPDGGRVIAPGDPVRYLPLGSFGL